MKSETTDRGAKTIEMLSTEDLIPYARNARTHSDEQVSQIAASILQFGFNNPILIDEKGGIVAGHGRVIAARRIKMAAVPCIRLAHLTEAEKRAYILADNKIAEASAWDLPMLESELDELNSLDLGLDLESLGLGRDESDPVEAAQTEPQSETDEVADVFWISVVGPLKHQAHAIDRLRSVMADLEPVTVEMGTVSRG